MKQNKRSRLTFRMYRRLNVDIWGGFYISSKLKKRVRLRVFLAFCFANRLFLNLLKKYGYMEKIAEDFFFTPDFSLEGVRLYARRYRLARGWCQLKMVLKSAIFHCIYQRFVFFYNRFFVSEELKTPLVPLTAVVVSKRVLRLRLERELGSIKNKLRRGLFPPRSYRVKFKRFLGYVRVLGFWCLKYLSLVGFKAGVGSIYTKIIPSVLFRRKYFRAYRAMKQAVYNYKVYRNRRNYGRGLEIFNPFKLKRLRQKYKVNRFAFFRLDIPYTAPFGRRKNFFLTLKVFRRVLALYYGGISKYRYNLLVRTVRAIKNSNEFDFYKVLEMRLSNVLSRFYLVKSVFHARQLVKHGFVCVNNKIVNDIDYKTGRKDWVGVCCSYRKFFKKLLLKRVRRNLFFRTMRFLSIFEHSFLLLSVFFSGMDDISEVSYPFRMSQRTRYNLYNRYNN